MSEKNKYGKAAGDDFLATIPENDGEGKECL